MIPIFTAAVIAFGCIYFQRYFGDEQIETVTVYKYRERGDRP